MSINTYAAKRVSISYLGESIVGVADGTFISVTPNSDVATYSIGAQGDSACSVSADTSASVEITLLQNSPSNVTFAALLNAFNSGTSDFPEGALVIKDPSAPFIPILKGVKVMSRPTFSRGKDQENQVWRLHAASYEQIPQVNKSANFLSKLLSANTAVDALKDLLDF